METSKKFKKIIHSSLLILMMVLVIFSCRKDDPIPDPVDPGPGDPAKPVVFVNKPLNILSDYEKSKKLNFPGNTIHKLGTGLVGEIGHAIWEGISVVGEVVWEAYDYHHTESRFDDIDEQLDEVQDQIADLENTIKDMSNYLHISFDDLNSFIYSGSLNTQIGYVKTAMDSASMDGLMYYPKTGRLYQADTNNPDLRYKMQMLSAYAPTWATTVYHNQGDNSMKNIIIQMQQDLCPPLGTGDNALHAYAKRVIELCEGKISDSNSAMNAYLLFESYFLTVINYQFQAATVYINAANMIDTTGQLASDFWETYMNGIIPGEVDVFLENVDYLTINLSEYRTNLRFTHDMQYAAAGLAPEKQFQHVYARSQFLANLLYAASGKQHPVISGHIVIPNKYAAEAATSPDELSLQIGGKTITSAATVLPSMIPYPIWSVSATCGDAVDCAPDNKWNLFRFNDYDTNWTCTPQTIQITENGPNLPWPHQTEIIGTFTPLYYNPMDPSQSSVTRTSTCTFQFAYFSANWQWGFLQYRYNPTAWDEVNYSSSSNAYFDMEHYDDRFDNEKILPVPGALRWEKASGSSSFSGPKAIPDITYDRTFGSLSSHGLLQSSTSKAYKCIVDFRESLAVMLPVKSLDHTSPNGTNGANTTEVWLEYSGSVYEDNQYASSGKNKITISMGNDVCHNAFGNFVYVPGTMIHDEFTLNHGTTLFPAKFVQKEIEDSYCYAGFQYFYYNEIPDTHNYNLKIDYNCQFIFTGSYALSD